MKPKNRTCKECVFFSPIPGSPTGYCSFSTPMWSTRLPQIAPDEDANPCKCFEPMPSVSRFTSLHFRKRGEP